MPGTASATSPTLGLFYAMSEDGRRFTERQKIPTQGVPRHVQVTVTPASQILVAWDEQSPGTRRIAIARGTIDRNGVAQFTTAPIADDVAGNYPIVASADASVIVGWTSGETGKTVIRTKRLTD
jgi:hypothetical protein